MRKLPPPIEGYQRFATVTKATARVCRYLYRVNDASKRKLVTTTKSSLLRVLLLIYTCLRQTDRARSTYRVFEEENIKHQCISRIYV